MFCFYKFVAASLLIKQVLLTDNLPFDLSLNVFDDGAVLVCSIFWTLSDG
jgi:hypothetical protein